jgi:hypothetical protein
MFQTIWSTGDGAYACTGVPGVDGHATNTDCLNGGGTSTGVCPGSWCYAQDTASPDQPSIVGGLINPNFGCSNTPTQVIQDTAIYVRTYTGCTSNSANGTEVQSIDYDTSGCHAYGCNGQQGGQTYLAQVEWNFWTTGTTSPES